MQDLQQKLDKLILNIPYDEIREKSFQRLNDASLLDGRGQDIHFMILEQVDIFKSDEMKKLKQEVWDHVFRQVRKNLAHGVVEWTQKRVSEEYMKKELETVELGDASTA